MGARTTHSAKPNDHAEKRAACTQQLRGAHAANGPLARAHDAQRKADQQAEDAKDAHDDALARELRVVALARRVPRRALRRLAEGLAILAVERFAGERHVAIGLHIRGEVGVPFAARGAVCALSLLAAAPRW